MRHFAATLLLAACLALTTIAAGSSDSDGSAPSDATFDAAAGPVVVPPGAAYVDITVVNVGVNASVTIANVTATGLVAIEAAGSAPCPGAAVTIADSTVGAVVLRGVTGTGARVLLHRVAVAGTPRSPHGVHTATRVVNASVTLQYVTVAAAGVDLHGRDTALLLYRVSAPALNVTVADTRPRTTSDELTKAPGAVTEALAAVASHHGGHFSGLPALVVLLCNVTRTSFGDGSGGGAACRIGQHGASAWVLSTRCVAADDRNAAAAIVGLWVHATAAAPTADAPWPHGELAVNNSFVAALAGGRLSGAAVRLAASNLGSVVFGPGTELRSTRTSTDPSMSLQSVGRLVFDRATYVADGAGLCPEVAAATAVPAALLLLDSVFRIAGAAAVDLRRFQFLPASLVALPSPGPGNPGSLYMRGTTVTGEGAALLLTTTAAVTTDILDCHFTATFSGDLSGAGSHAAVLLGAAPNSTFRAPVNVERCTIAAVPADADAAMAPATGALPPSTSTVTVAGLRIHSSGAVAAIKLEGNTVTAASGNATAACGLVLEQLPGGPTAWTVRDNFVVATGPVGRLSATGIMAPSAVSVGLGFVFHNNTVLATTYAQPRGFTSTAPQQVTGIRLTLRAATANAVVDICHNTVVAAPYAANGTTLLAAPSNIDDLFLPPTMEHSEAVGIALSLASNTTLSLSLELQANAVSVAGSTRANALVVHDSSGRSNSVSIRGCALSSLIAPSAVVGPSSVQCGGSTRSGVFIEGSNSYVVLVDSAIDTSAAPTPGHELVAPAFDLAPSALQLTASAATITRTNISATAVVPLSPVGCNGPSSSAVGFAVSASAPRSNGFFVNGSSIRALNVSGTVQVIRSRVLVLQSIISVSCEATVWSQETAPCFGARAIRADVTDSVSALLITDSTVEATGVLDVAAVAVAPADGSTSLKYDVTIARSRLSASTSAVVSGDGTLPPPEPPMGGVPVVAALSITAVPSSNASTPVLNTTLVTSECVLEANVPMASSSSVAPLPNSVAAGVAFRGAAGSVASAIVPATRLTIAANSTLRTTSRGAPVVPLAADVGAGSVLVRLEYSDVVGRQGAPAAPRVLGTVNGTVPTVAQRRKWGIDARCATFDSQPMTAELLTYPMVPLRVAGCGPVPTPTPDTPAPDSSAPTPVPGTPAPTAIPTTPAPETPAPATPVRRDLLARVPVTTDLLALKRQIQARYNLSDSDVSVARTSDAVTSGTVVITIVLSGRAGGAAAVAMLAMTPSEQAAAFSGMTGLRAAPTSAPAPDSSFSKWAVVVVVLASAVVIIAVIAGIVAVRSVGRRRGDGYLDDASPMLQAGAPQSDFTKQTV